MGTDEQKLKTSYKWTVRLNLEYSSSAYVTTANDNLLSLDKTKKQTLLIITGAMMSTMKEHQTPVT